MPFKKCFPVFYSFKLESATLKYKTLATTVWKLCQFWKLSRSVDGKIHPKGREYLVRILFFFFSSGGWGKIKLKLTTLPRTFIRVVYRFNSVAFATQR